MADFNINVKAKGASGGARRGGGAAGPPLDSKMSAERQKAIQASKTADGGKNNINAQMANNIKALTNSIHKLIESNKALTNALKRSPAGGGGGGAPGAGRAAIGDASGGGAVGSALPFVGAAIAISAFVAQKVNQIGNAYISKTAEQKGSVGTGGFRRGEGMYNATEMGAGMKAYAMESGKFATDRWSKIADKSREQRNLEAQFAAEKRRANAGAGKDTYVETAMMKQLDEKIKTLESGRRVGGFSVRPDETALQVGGIFGLSADEVLGQAGKFKRAGGSYGQIAKTLAGGGLETQIPMMIGAISTELEDAVRNGLNTSNLSTDIAEDMSALTMSTQNRDAITAINFAKTASGAKSSAARGQVGDVEQMLLWQGGQKAMIDEMGDLTKRSKMLTGFKESGVIGDEEFQRIMSMKNVTAEGLAKESPTLLNAMTKEYVSGLSEAKSLQLISEGAYSAFGTGGTEAQRRRSAESVMDQMGGGISRQALRAGSKMATARGGINAAEGEKMLAQQYKGVIGSEAGIGVAKDRMLENLLLNHGQMFADATVKMTKALTEFAGSTASVAEDMIKQIKESQKPGSKSMAAQATGHLRDMFNFATGK
jgi:hypothetical protein